MFSIYNLKPRFQKILMPAMERLWQAGITPNLVTSIAFLGSFLTGIFIITNKHQLWSLLILPVWLFIRMALNAIDGMMARQFYLSTPLGAVLNETGDVFADIFLYLPLVVFYPGTIWALYLFVLVAVLSEFCGVLCQALGTIRCYDGPMGKSDRAFFVSVLALATFIFPRIIAWWSNLFYLASILCLLTCWKRLRHGYFLLKKGR
jgi:CDP-diacylglycerol--glycerol-3-phosphate 3-phosphatidyltransferase